jgi:spore coat protein U-like protein
MKKLLLLLMVLSLAAFTCSARQTSGAITVTVTVTGTFTMLVDTDSFDFAKLAPGETGEMTRKDGILVTCASTNGEPWNLNVSSTGPLSSGSDQIPNDSFIYNGRTIASEGAAYTSSVAEANEGSKVINNFKFSLNVPENTRPGNYTTTVMFTMTE